jgi:hypothetical protein
MPDTTITATTRHASSLEDVLVREMCTTVSALQASYRALNELQDAIGEMERGAEESKRLLKEARDERDVLKLFVSLMTSQQQQHRQTSASSSYNNTAATGEGEREVEEEEYEP